MKWITQLGRRRQLEAGMREEMEFHREARTADLIARGMEPGEAARTARLEFGNAGHYIEESRAELGYRPWDELRADLRFAVRGLRSNPGFSAAAVSILALAIGVNAAFFTIYSNYAWKPLPVRGIERHVAVSGLDRTGRTTFGWNSDETAALRQAAAGEIEGIYASDTFQVLVLAPVQRQSLITTVSGNYFQLLGGTAIRGRTITGTEEREPVAVLSSSGAARFFPDDADPTGKQLRVRSTILTIIGVANPSFSGAVAVVPDFWVGLGMESALRGQASTVEARNDLAGLLAPGAALERAEALLTAAASHFPRPGGEPVARVQLRSQRTLLPESDDTNAAAALVFAAFWIVLLIACANLANLYLARAAARTHEVAMRLSLGASRARIVRQLLTESAFTALLGAAGGCLIAIFTVQQAHAYAISLSGVKGITMLPVTVDWRVILYSIALGLAAALAFGLLPALEITSPSLTLSTKRENASFAGRVSPRRMRNALIAGQAAASLVLLILGGVLIRNIHRLDSVDAGYDLNRVFDLNIEQPSASTLTLLARQPGVTALTAVERVPLYGRLDRIRVDVQNRTQLMFYNRVDHRYFETLGLAVQGRGFTASESANRAKVAVVSRATARKLWAATEPIGQTFTIGGESSPGVYQVIGIAPDVVSGWFFEGKDSSAIYLPAAAGQPGVRAAMARIDGNPAATSAALSRLCAQGTGATGCEPTSLRAVCAMQRFPFQIAAAAAGALGALALLLTAIGIHGVVGYSVVRRRREIGVRLALGATPGHVIRRIVFEAVRCVAIGLAMGLPVCLALSKLAASSIFQIRTFDPAAYTAVPVLLIAITTLACAVPARRASRIDPMRSLREE